MSAFGTKSKYGAAAALWISGHLDSSSQKRSFRYFEGNPQNSTMTAFAFFGIPAATWNNQQRAAALGLTSKPSSRARRSPAVASSWKPSNFRRRACHRKSPDGWPRHVLHPSRPWKDASGCKLTQRIAGLAPSSRRVVPTKVPPYQVLRQNADAAGGLLPNLVGRGAIVCLQFAD